MVRKALLGVLLIPFAVLLGCSGSYKQRRDSKLVDELNYQTAKKLAAERNLKLFGTGAQMMYDIRMLALSFIYNEEVDIKKARTLILDAGNEYLSVINSNEEIQQYLHNRPFTFENIEIRVFFRNANNGDVASGKITVAAAIKGKFRYDIADPQTDQLKTIFTETYEEALKAQ